MKPFFILLLGTLFSFYSIASLAAATVDITGHYRAAGNGIVEEAHIVQKDNMYFLEASGKGDRWTCAFSGRAVNAAQGIVALRSGAQETTVAFKNPDTDAGLVKATLTPQGGLTLATEGSAAPAFCEAGGKLGAVPGGLVKQVEGSADAEGVKKSTGNQPAKLMQPGVDVSRKAEKVAADTSPQSEKAPAPTSQKPDKASAAANPMHPVCAVPDFMEFIKKYSELSMQEQASCARFPLQAKGKRYASFQELLASKEFKEHVIISSRKRMSGPKIKVAKELFMQAPANGDVVNVKSGDIVYVIQERKDTMEVLLTQGGTFIFETVTFFRKDDYWRVLKIEEASNDY